MLPLFQDLRAQRPAVRSFLLKALLLVALFLCLDRLIGHILLGGLERYYGLNEPAVVLCVGHSHTVLGIDKVALERALGVPVAKFAVEGANTSDRLAMVRYYLARQAKSVRAVVYDVDAHAFTSAGLSSASYQLLFPFIGDPEIRAYIKEHCASQTEYLLRRLLWLPRYDELTITLAARGYFKKWTNLKLGTINAERLNEQVREGRFRKIAFDEASIGQFGKMVECARGGGRTLLLTYIPTVDIMNRAEPEKFERAMGLFRGFATRSGVVFLDYNRDYERCHEFFFDPIHLNPAGQKVVTARLAEDLQKVLGKAAPSAAKTD
jgi:hypothetical protein